MDLNAQDYQYLLEKELSDGLTNEEYKRLFELRGILSLGKKAA